MTKIKQKKVSIIISEADEENLYQKDLSDNTSFHNFYQNVRRRNSSIKAMGGRSDLSG